MEMSEIESLKEQLREANDTIEAIRRGEIDALVIKGKKGNEVFTLESADRTYRVFLEKMNEGAVTLNASGIIQYCNSSFASMINRTPANVTAELFEDFVSSDDRQYLRDLLRQGWKLDVKGEVSLIADNGSIPVQLSLTPLRLGKVFSLSILVTDLSGQKEAQLQLKLKNEQLAASILALEVSNNDLQQFAYVASHDLQEPLRRILRFAHTLKDKFEQELLNISMMSAIDKVIASATRMKILIVNILDYALLSHEDLNFESTDLDVLIHELLEDLELVIGEKKALIFIDKMPVMPAIKTQLRQVFHNLIGNALKFVKAGDCPNIDITSSDVLEGFGLIEKFPEKFFHIHVRDKGIGFEDKYTKSIFNLYERLNSKDVYEGTGIGLAVCKKIIEKHHGHISVNSKPGIGSEFIISLPLSQENYSKEQHASSKMSILLLNLIF